MSTKKIYEFGGFPPNNNVTADCSSYIANNSTWANVQQAPIDGFAIGALADNGRYFTHEIWGHETLGIRAYSIDDFSTFISNLQSRASSGWGRVWDNFLTIQTLSRTIDWFSEDINHVVNNLKLMGRIATESGLQGLFIEPEQYGTHVWRYTGMPNKAYHTQEQYESRIQEVTEEIAHAWLQYNNEIKVSFLKSYYFGETDPDYAMYSPFLDGIYSVFGQSRKRLRYSKGRTLGEIYRPTPTKKLLACTSSTSIEQDYNEILTKYNAQLVPYTGNTGYFEDVNEFMLEHWVDNSNTPFDNVDPSGNYFSPSVAKTSLKNMLSIVDKVWLYNESYHFFGPGNIINSQYTDKFWELRRELGIY